MPISTRQRLRHSGTFELEDDPAGVLIKCSLSPSSGPKISSRGCCHNWSVAKSGRVLACEFGAAILHNKSAHSHRTEPNTGLETLKLRTLATKDGESYSISGQKM